MTREHKFTSAGDAATFALAGDAILTLSSARTGSRFTYKVSAAKNRETSKRPDHPTLYFVSLLTGPNNMGDYTYLGCLKITHVGPVFTTTAKSRLPNDSVPVKAFAFFTRSVLAAGRLHPELEVRHEGRCGRCNRRLTVPESIDRGIGPECAGIMSDRGLERAA